MLTWSNLDNHACQLLAELNLSIYAFYADCGFCRTWLHVRLPHQCNDIFLLNNIEIRENAVMKKTYKKIE